MIPKSKSNIGTHKKFVCISSSSY